METKIFRKSFFFEFGCVSVCLSEFQVQTRIHSKSKRLSELLELEWELHNVSAGK